MEYIIIGLLVVILIISLISLMKSINTSNVGDSINNIEKNIIKELGEFKTDIGKNSRDDFDKLSERLDLRIRLLNDKVNERLDENFEKTNKTFTNVLERLTKIDEAQKKIDTLGEDIVSLQTVLTDKKSRGTFGEVNLYHIMSNVFGESSDLYKMQYTFENGSIADCVLFAPEPLGVIAIDSKFPLENYERMVDKDSTVEVRKTAEKDFKTNMKKHIDDISSKYIIPGVTSDQAILFLPAEAIFAEVNAYHTDIIEYAYKKRVWITSPTTLISTLTTIEVIVKNMERDKYAKVIQNELKLLNDEFLRYKERWDRLSTHIDTVSKDVKELHTTSEKIAKRFDSINQVDVDKLEHKDK